MLNSEIIANPVFVDLIQRWWDEKTYFARGTTSGVIADWLEDRGWAEPYGLGPNRNFLDWMRGPPGPGAVVSPPPAGYTCWLHEAAKIVVASVHSLPRCPIHEMLNQALRMSHHHRDKRLLCGREAYARITLSPEVHTLVYDPGHGVIDPTQLYGFRIAQSDSVHPGHAVIMVDDWVETRRIA